MNDLEKGRKVELFNLDRDLALGRLAEHFSFKNQDMVHSFRLALRNPLERELVRLLLRVDFGLTDLTADEDADEELNLSTLCFYNP